MTIQIRKAERRKAKLRLGLAAPSGAGKTYSSLLLAKGLGGKIGMIDTENGSGDLYAGLTDYDIINIQAPYTVAKYLEGIKAFEDAGYDTIIIDSLSHAWSGEGGLLDKQGKIADRTGNSYTAWRNVTPDHNALVEAMIGSKCHIIAATRSKQEYVQEKNDQGKTVVRKVGMAPVQREGLEFEFTVMLDIDMNHIASSSKDRTGLFDGLFFKITPETGKQLLGWLESGEDAIVVNDFAVIEAATDMKALEIAFRTAAGKFKDDAIKLEKITEAKDKRKAELMPPLVVVQATAQLPAHNVVVNQETGEITEAVAAPAPKKRNSAAAKLAALPAPEAIAVGDSLVGGEMPAFLTKAK